MQDDSVEPPIQRVGNAHRRVKVWIACGGDRCPVKLEGRAFVPGASAKETGQSCLIMFIDTAGLAVTRTYR